MELETLKGKIDDAAFGELSAFVGKIVAERDDAVNKSEDGRQKFKRLSDERDALRKTRDTLLEKLGLDSEDGLGDLPDAKGQAEALRQLEAKMKRLERERQEAIDARTGLEERVRSRDRAESIRKVLAEHQWIDQDAAQALFERGVQWEGDELRYLLDGKPVSLADGAAALAKNRPGLIKAHGAGGSGYTPPRGSGAPNVAPKRSDFTSDVDFYRASAQFAAQQAPT